MTFCVDSKLAFRARDRAGLDRAADSRFERLHLDSRPITEDFGHALHQLIRVIADADNRIGLCHVCVNQHGVKRLPTGALGEFCKERDVPAQQGLQAGPQGPKHRP